MTLVRTTEILQLDNLKGIFLTGLFFPHSNLSCVLLPDSSPCSVFTLTPIPHFMCCVIWNNDMASSRLHFPHVKWAQSSLPSPSYRVGERTKWGSAFFYLKTKCLVDIKYYYHYYYYYYCYYSRTLIDPGINFRPLSFQESLVTID